MSDVQFGVLAGILILNGLALVMLGVEQHFQNKSINALVDSFSRLFNELVMRR